ncbi:hypothetical protein NXY56_000374 [Leishmania guyanensis]
MAHSWAEPSALDFLSPHSKDARESSFQLVPSAESHRPHRRRGCRNTSASGAMLRPPAEHPRHKQHNREDTLYNKDDFDGQQTSVGVDGEAYTAPPHSAVTTLSPASPSRSLYADVEAAQQPLSPVVEALYVPPSTPTPAPSSSNSAVKRRHQESSTFDKKQRWEEKGEDDVEQVEAATLVTQADVTAAITAALRRYEKERDAEEEAVLQQVSKEVEEQASRYANLIEAYNTVCADRATLQEKLAETARECDELRHALQRSRQTQQALTDSAKRLEVELCHTKDLQQQQQRTLLKTEVAEWEAQRARYETRQGTLEAQLDQAREELRAMEARVSEKNDELAALRERAAKASTETANEYADIHLRMRQLAQNMATMEDALCERDTTIAEQAARLREAAERRESEVRAATAEREKTEAALTSARDALQRQTDDTRRRMHRVTELQHQRDALKEEEKATRRALQAASEDQGRVLQSLQHVLAIAKQSLSCTTDSAGHAGPPSSELSSRSPHRFTASWRGGHMDRTLVYEDDHEDNAHALRSCSAISPPESRSGSANCTPERSSTEEDNARSEKLFSLSALAAEKKHRSASSPKSCSHRASHSPSVAAPSQRRARTSSPPQSARVAARETPAKYAKGSPSVHNTYHELHHRSSQALILLRELHRCVSALTLKRRKSSSGRDVAPSNTSGSVGRSGATAAKLQQACRYLKSELDRVQAALKETQAECQWRSLSMKKLEEDVQAARCGVLAAEKQRLACEMHVETAALVREELEAQLMELKATCVETTAGQRASEDAVAEAKAAAERSAALAEEAAQLKEAAESALAREKAKSARQATSLRDQAAAQTALTDELEELKEKHKAALAQLQTHHAREAELAELRSVVATMRTTHGTAAEAWKTERASLGALVSSLETKLRALTETTMAAKRRCATLEEQLALHADVERATLKTIGDIAHAPPLPPSLDAAAMGGDSYTSHAHDAVLATEKQLFGNDDEAPEVEDVVVVSTEATPSGSSADRELARVASHTRTTTVRTTALSLVSARLPVSSATPSRVAPSTAVSPASAPPFGGASLEAATSSPVATLAPLRQHIVAAVHQLALEAVRLRQGSVLPTMRSPIITQPRIATCRPRDMTSSEGWYTGETAHDGVCSDAKRPCTAALSSPPPLEAFIAPQPQPRYQHQHQSPRTPHKLCPSTTSAAQPRTLEKAPQPIQHSDRSQIGGSPMPSQPSRHATAGSPSGSYSPPVSAATTAAVGEHIYNVTRPSSLRPQWSLSLPSSPPASHVTVATNGKLWNEARRSASIKDGLSGYSSSTGRGSVDGSCSPARPPSLRALSLPL